MKRPVESDYTSHVAYTRALEEYCDVLRQPAPVREDWGPGPHEYHSLPPAAQPAPVPWSQALESVWAEPDEATPPAAQRQWVGLTDEERDTLIREFNGLAVSFYKAIEIKLKEKNT